MMHKLWLTVLALLVLPLTVHAQSETQAFALDSSFAAEAGGLQFDYPQMWTLEENAGQVVLATDSATLTAAARDLTSGQMRAVVFGGNVADWPAVTAKSSLDEMVTALIDDPAARRCDAFSQPTVTELDDRTELSAVRQCRATDQLVLVIDAGQGAMTGLFAVAPQGTMHKFSATLTDVAASVAVVAAPTQVVDVDHIDLSRTYQTAQGGFTFDYPADWYVHEERIRGATFVIVTPSERFDFRNPRPGEPFAIMLVSSVSHVTDAPLAPDLTQRPVDAMRALNSHTETVTFDTPVALAVGERVGSRTDAHTTTIDNSAFILMLNDDDYAYMNAFAGAGRMADLESTYLAILASFRITAIPGSGPVT